MKRIHTAIAAGATLVALAISPLAGADIVSITAARDATLYQADDGSLANGAGQYLFAGRTAQGLTRRALLWFDIASIIPDGATITSARLILNVSQANGGNREMTVHRALTAWTSGASDPSGTESTGTDPTTGDATWLHSSADGAGGGSLWQSVGGDFAAGGSASLLTTTAGLQTWSSAGLLDDVRLFAGDGTRNLGWFILGDESASTTARRFDSADSAALGGIVPRLEVEFTTVPSPGAIALLAAAGLRARRRR